MKISANIDKKCSFYKSKIVCLFVVYYSEVTR